MDFFERRIGRSANDFLVDLLATLDDPRLYTVVCEQGKASVKLNIAGSKSVVNLVHGLLNELEAYDATNAILENIRIRNLQVKS
ncbi:MAG: hypothetical protein Q7T86_03290 [Hyphomicrobiaceae bacterium]|nr:hypothetical protein [Hyphomicrobiaceae bacterium]